MLYDAVRVASVVDGVPILERFPVTFSGSRGPLPPYTLYCINGSVFPYKRLVKADEIARVYQKALENEGLEWGENGTRITYEFQDYIEVGVVGSSPLAPGELARPSAPGV
jgi:hypothetical protein